MPVNPKGQLKLIKMHSENVRKEIGSVKQNKDLDSVDTLLLETAEIHIESAVECLRRLSKGYYQENIENLCIDAYSDPDVEDPMKRNPVAFLVNCQLCIEQLKNKKE